MELRSSTRCCSKTLREDGQDVRAIYERNDSPPRQPPQSGGGPGRQGARDPSWSSRMASPGHREQPEDGLLPGPEVQPSRRARAAGGRRVICHALRPLQRAGGGVRSLRDVTQTAIDLAAANARLNGLDASIFLPAQTCSSTFPSPRDQAPPREGASTSARPPPSPRAAGGAGQQGRLREINTRP